MEHSAKDILTRKSTLYWVFQIIGWGAIFVLFIINNLSDGLTNQLLLDSSFTVLCLFAISHLFRNFIHRRNWLKVMFGRLLPRILLAAFVLSLIAIPFQILSSWLFNPTIYNVANLIAAFLEGSIFFFFWQVAYFLYHYVNNYNRNLKLEAMINEFELNKLKSQLNPHFIFNALNSVKALVDEEPEKAKDSIYQLSSILRSSLMMDKKKVIPFNEELGIVENYLELEGTRFEERLRVRYEIHPDSLEYKLPPMMLQTIVENGIKHGISKIKNGGEIGIKTEVKEGLLIIQIRNTGKYQPPKSPRTSGGYGLTSTLQRLELLYHKKASFKIMNESDNVVLTELTIPPWDVQEPTTIAASF